MKRPEGFDRAGRPQSGPFASASRPRASAPADRGGSAGRGGSANRDEPDTEPIPIVAAASPAASPAPAVVSERLRTASRNAGVASNAEAPQSPQSQPPQPSQPQPPQSSPRRALRQAQRERKRYERGEVRRFTKRTRRRRAIWLVSAGSVVALALIAVLTAFSPLMALQKIEVVGTSRLEASTVAKALKGQLGRPLPLIDFAAVRKDLDSYPLIRSYSTETHPPGTLVVRIVERTPLGLLKTKSGFDLVDAAGVVVSSSAERPGGYPVITLTGTPTSAAGRAPFAASAAVLSALPASVLPQVDSITAKTTDDVTLTLSSGKSVVWGSPEKSDLKAADLAALLKQAPDASTYDVSSPLSPVIG